MVDNPTNALALAKYGYDQCQKSVPILAKGAEHAPSSARNIEVTGSEATSLRNLLRAEVEKYRALVDLEKLRKDKSGGGTAKASAVPLSERLEQYPEQVDLENVVTYPPQFVPIPVKPLFMDVAWNYIEYPDKTTMTDGKNMDKAGDKKSESEQKPQARGWFGFGRT